MSPVKAEAGKLDLKKISNLDLKKASDWKDDYSGTSLKVKNGILSVEGPTVVSYKYKCSSKISIIFRLKVEIKPAPVKSVTLSDTTFTYTGDPIEPDVTVKAEVMGKTVTLTKDKDFTVTYKSNTKVGTAKVIVKGINLYTGTVTTTFKIKKK